MNRIFVPAALVVSSLLAFSGAVSAADVFVEPAVSKSGAHSYNITAFVNEPQDGISFVVELPEGVQKVSTAECGVSAGGSFAKCMYEPSTRKLAVVLLRMDGEPLDMREYALGAVTFTMTKGAKLSPFQVENVQARSRHGQAGAAAGTAGRSTNAER